MENTKKKTLFEIGATYKEFEKMLEGTLAYFETDEGQAIPEDERNEMLAKACEISNANKTEIEAKVNSYLTVLDKMKSEKNRIRERINFLTSREAKQQKDIERLMDNLDFNLKNLGIDKMDTADYKLSYRVQPEKVIIDDGIQLDKKYLKEKITYTHDKTLLKELLKNGEKIKGVRIGQEEPKLTIK